MVERTSIIRLYSIDSTRVLAVGTVGILRTYAGGWRTIPVCVVAAVDSTHEVEVEVDLALLLTTNEMMTVAR